MSHKGFHSSMIDYQEQVSQAYQLYKNKQNDQALFILRKIIQQAPTEAAAWWGLAIVSTNPVEKRRAAERVLILKPDHRGAPKMLKRLAEEQRPAAKARKTKSAKKKAKPVTSHPLGAAWLWFILLLLGFIFVATIAIGAALFLFILSSQPV
jgi:ferric-dicitrate binding protein FerR (iron transport regulator)